MKSNSKNTASEKVTQIAAKRNNALMKELRKLQASEADLLERKATKKEVQSAEAEIIPAT